MFNYTHLEVCGFVTILACLIAEQTDVSLTCILKLTHSSLHMQEK